MAAKKKEVTHAVVMGIPVDIDAEVFDNLELLDMLDDIQNGDVLKIAKALHMVFGDQWGEIKKKLRNEKGVIAASKASEFFVEVMSSVDEAKN